MSFQIPPLTYYLSLTAYHADPRISCKIKYLDCEDYNKLEAQLQEVSAMLGSMIRTLKRQRDRDGEKIQ